MSENNDSDKTTQTPEDSVISEGEVTTNSVSTDKVEGVVTTRSTHTKLDLNTGVKTTTHTVNGVVESVQTETHDPAKVRGEATGGMQDVLNEVAQAVRNPDKMSRVTVTLVTENNKRLARDTFYRATLFGYGFTTILDLIARNIAGRERYLRHVGSYFDMSPFWAWFLAIALISFWTAYGVSAYRRTKSTTDNTTTL